MFLNKREWNLQTLQECKENWNKNHEHTQSYNTAILFYKVG